MRGEVDRPTFPPAQVQSRDMSELYGFDAMTGVWRRVSVDPSGAIIVVGGGGVTETDDNSIASGQMTSLIIDIPYMFDGTSWIRIQGGTDNTVAPASPQALFTGGVVEDTPVPGTYADGDVSVSHFDTAGRLLVSGVTTSAHTEMDDNDVAPGHTVDEVLNINYVFNGTSWIRLQGGVDNAVAPASSQGAFVGGVVTDPLEVFVDGDISLLHFDTSGRLLVNAEGVTDTDDNAISPGQTTGLGIELEYIFNGTDWIRLQGGVDNAAAPASPQGAFVGGVVTEPFDIFVDGDVSLLHFDLSGRLLTKASPGVAGTVITAGANTAVGAGATVALPALPAGTIAIHVQNRTLGGATRVLVRQAGGAAGTGIELTTRGSIVFDKAVAALEAQNFAGPAATVAILFERL